MTQGFAHALTPQTQKSAVPFIQRKAKLGAVNDPLEYEADAVAARVVTGQSAGAISVASGGVQRKCAACQAEEEEHLQRKAVAGVGQVPPSKAEGAAQAVATGGRPLSAAQRRYFEPRFGRDFSGVRLHDHAAAREAAQTIGARAFTWQNNIGLGAGDAASDAKLLAHELTHVAQQLPHVARQAAPFHSRTFHDDEGGDLLDYFETVQNQPTQTVDGIVGSVDRRVEAPARGARPREVTHRGRVGNIRLTPDGRVIVPYRIQFQSALTASSQGICTDPPTATAVPQLPPAKFTRIQNEYIAAMNRGLNNRFALRVTGCTNDQSFSNRLIPIVITAEAVTNAADRTIRIVNRGGRADAANVCAGDFSTLLPIHEGGHQALGAPDEYQEYDQALIARVNAPPQPLHWERPERVRTDMSYMNSQDDVGGNGLFHERHFRFAQVFVEAALRGQGCSVDLVRTGSPPPEFRVDATVGSTSLNNGTSPLALSLFAGISIPTSVSRRLSLSLGAQGQAFLNTNPRIQDAFMLGLRAGIHLQSNPGSFGVGGGVFGSVGGLYQPGSSSDPTVTSRSQGYGEVGANVGIHSGMVLGGTNFRLGVEGATGRELSSSPDALQWYRAGITFGLSR